MLSLLEVAKAAAVVKHSWQIGMGDLPGLGLGVWSYTKKQGAGFLERMSKVTFSSSACSFSGCGWAELGTFVTTLQVLMIPRPHLPQLSGDQTGKYAGWTPLNLYWVFLEGYNRIWPESEEFSPSSSPFLGGRRFCCFQLECCGCCVKMLLWTGHVQVFPTPTWVRQVLVRGSSVWKSLKQNLVGDCSLLKRQGDQLTKHQVMKQKGQDIFF